MYRRGRSTEVCTVTCHYINQYIQVYIYWLKSNVTIASVLLIILDNIIIQRV